MIKDVVRNLPPGLLRRDLFQEVIAKETPRKEAPLIGGEAPFSNQLLQLEKRIIFPYFKDRIFRPPGQESGVSCQDHPALLSGQLKQRIGFLPPIINRIVAQYSQFPGQFSQGSISNKLHGLFSQRAQPLRWLRLDPRSHVFPDNRFQIPFCFFRDHLPIGDQSVLKGCCAGTFSPIRDFSQGPPDGAFRCLGAFR